MKPKFIRLSLMGNGNSIYVNVNRIVSFNRPVGESTYLELSTDNFTDKDLYRVIDTPEQIIEKIKEAYSEQ